MKLLLALSLAALPFSPASSGPTAVDRAALKSTTAAPVFLLATTRVAAVQKPARTKAARAALPSQGYRCSGPAAASGTSPPPGAAVIKRVKLTLLKRPTPTSAVVQVDVTLTKPHKLAIFNINDVPGMIRREGVLYTFSATSGTVRGNGPRVIWTLEGEGARTIAVEVNKLKTLCITYASATYTISAPRPGPGGASVKPQWQIDYDNKMALYNQELARQRQAVADNEARRAQLRSKAESVQAAWRAAVAACQAGDYSQCSRPPPQ